MVDETFRSGYAPVNGLQLYYEIHGGLGMTGMFGDLLPRYTSFSSPLLADVVVPFLEATLPVAG